MNLKRIMKQPDLGKKIVELRKAKGLTQEELVSLCNLNVRTLQRIESGEVSPRSYTVKTIFTALDFDLHVAHDSGPDNADMPASRLSTWPGQLYRYSIDLFNLKTNTMKKISILTVLVCTLTFGFITIFSDGQAQSTEKVKEAIAETNQDFVRFFNEGKVDSLVAIYRDDACLPGKGCGKEVVLAYFQANMLVGYKFKSLNTSSLTVEKSVAVEKGTYTIEFKNGQQMSGDYITEWKLTDKKWRIANDLANVSSVQPNDSDKW
ncbi:MAG TPA: helix-turn-helix domain-containing protein [Ohtaekwangia sp.]